MNEVRDRLIVLMERRKFWSAKVKTKWSPKKGFFKQSANKIASGLKAASKNLKQSMSRLNFYINRMGKKLKPAEKSKLETAKKKLRALYASTDLRRQHDYGIEINEERFKELIKEDIEE